MKIFLLTVHCNSHYLHIIRQLHRFHAQQILQQIHFFISKTLNVEQNNLLLIKKINDYI